MRRDEAANLSQLRVGVLFNAQVCGILRRPTDGHGGRCARLSERTEEEYVCSREVRLGRERK